MKSFPVAQSAPVATSRKEQQLIEEAIRQSLQGRQSQQNVKETPSQRVLDGAAMPAVSDSAEVEIVEDSPDQAGPALHASTGKRYAHPPQTKIERLL